MAVARINLSIYPINVVEISSASIELSANEKQKGRLAKMPSPSEILGVSD
jgi:hypothetical protein